MYSLFLIIFKINKTELKLDLKPDKKHGSKNHLPITLGLVFIGLRGQVNVSVQAIHSALQRVAHAVQLC